MKIRKVAKRDRTLINSILTHAFGKDSLKFLEIELDQTLRIALKDIIEGYVLVKGKDEIVAYMVLRRWGGALNLDTLAIATEKRDSGYGAKMVGFAKKRCKKLGLMQINVITRYKNCTKFYEKLGFNKMGVLDGPYYPFSKKRFFLKWVNA